MVTLQPKAAVGRQKTHLLCQLKCTQHVVTFLGFENAKLQKMWHLKHGTYFQRGI
jgi:hypothetical protein